jgi:leukotriene-A4 hydrolase
MITQKFGVDKVALDIRDIDVKKVTDQRGKELEFQINSDINPELGQQLMIHISKRWVPETEVILVIDYVTSKDASAVTWLTKEQTEGGKMPYMYTQCESIHCRSIAPLQDTPAIKSTYTLHAKSPVEVIVRASGNITHEYTDELRRHTKFEMTIPVESYLLAFAGGNLEEKQLGARTFVITEPEIMEK